MRFLKQTLMKIVYMRIHWGMLLALLCWSALGQNVGADSSGHSDTIQKYHAAITTACATTMTNIVGELHGLAEKFPPLSGIGFDGIKNVGSTNFPCYAFGYWNRAFITNMPGAAGISLRPSNISLRPSNARLVVDKDGARLGIIIRDISDPFTPNLWGSVYPLLKTGKDEKITLVYHLQLGSTNPELDESVRDIMERHVRLLRIKLQNILAIDPDKERAQLCATAVTNILRGLQGLEKRFSQLSDMDSAVIRYGDATNFNDIHLEYRKNVEPVPMTNASNETQALERPTGGGNETALDFYILNVDDPIQMRTDTYHILFKTGDRVRIRYSYSLRWSSRDNEMRTAVAAVVQKEVNELREALKQTISFE
jgi:hypothetical protein